MKWFKPTLNAEIARYLESAPFKQLAPATRAKHKWLCPILARRFGRFRVNQISRRAVEEMMSVEIERPGTANNLLSLLRRLLRRSLRDGVIPADPTDGIRPLKLGKVHTWTEQEVEQFERCWPRGSTETLTYRPIAGHRGRRAISGATVRLAFDLLLWTDQRRTDVAKLDWSDITGGRIAFVQQKTGSALSLPFHRELERAIEGFPRGNGRVLKTPSGRDFTPDELSYAMRAAIRQAGLPERCRPHGLRKTTMRRIAEAGGSAHHLQSVSAHKDLREVSVYTEAVDQQKMSDEAFRLIVKPD